jgi:hypothetical protein
MACFECSLFWRASGQAILCVLVKVLPFNNTQDSHKLSLSTIYKNYDALV